MTVVARPLAEASYARLHTLPFEGGEDRRLIHRGPGGERVHWFPGHKVLRVEGRLDAILSGREDAHALRPASDLVPLERQVLELLGEMTGELLRVSEVARVDVAADVSCSANDGLAFLRVLRHAGGPRSKTAIWENARDGLPETVAFVTEKRGRILLRAYDKGVESGTAPRGELIRIERQGKFDKARRRRPDKWAETDLAALWASHLRPIAQQAEVTTVGVASALAEAVAAKIRAGEVTPAVGRSLLGSAHLLPLLGEDELPRSTRDRWAHQLRSHGLHEVRDGAAIDLHEVPLPALLREIADRFDTKA